MKPTYEELLAGATTWRKSHDGVSYILSFHGYDPDGYRFNQGIWCYYLLIPEQMYPHRWQDFACVRSEDGFEQPGPAFERGMFDTEITWSSSEPYYDRKERRTFDAAKVGCDYNHLWHSEMSYPDTYQSVDRDAVLTVEKFLKAHPDRRIRSGYSGKWGKPDEFYTAVNGRFVHKDDDIPSDWDGWKPTPPEDCGDE